jgi:hypothetical protein
MLVRSNPPGAVVYVDDYEIGTTPVSTSFTYYGKRKIRLVKNGFETLTVMQPVSVPWYQYFPIDFVSENLVPGDIRDNRTYDFQLVPQVVAPTEQLVDRAERLRQQTHASGVVQAAPSGAGRRRPSTVAPATGIAPTAAPASPPGNAWPGGPAPTDPLTTPPGGWPPAGS